MTNHRRNNRRGKRGGQGGGKSTRRRHQQAWAPYNFVPMPDKPLYAKAELDDDGKLPRHDVYAHNRHTGYFKIKLTTETPLFIRGMLETKDMLYEEDGIQKRKSDKEISELIRKNEHVFSVDGKAPVIPGSSLRGMLRTLVEIVSNSKMHFVGDAQPMFFRAVAADKTDPLKYPYEQIIGKFSKNVRAGYLIFKNGRWYVQPARKIGKSYFAKVKDWNRKQRYSPVEGVQDLIRFNSSNPEYKVQYHDVCYEANGDFVTRVYTPKEGQSVEGVLVCTGNMAETKAGTGEINSPRKNYALVAEPNNDAKRIPIPQQTVTDYLEGLSAFQKEEPFHKDYGVLVDGRPVFYVEEGGEVIHFGHTPNFRVAPLTVEKNIQRAANAKDLIPPKLRQQNPQVDYAEAMFGYVSEQDEKKEQSAYAGRISVSSAYVSEKRDSYTYDPITPKILSSPKPTTFQHYLEQPDGWQTPTHQLRHYGDDTDIRGHKLYWRQKIESLSQVEEPDKTKNPDTSTQHTWISPVREEVSFEFKLHFENLSNVELGALIWVLTLGGDKQARHQLGMGKPLGLGVVHLEPELVMTKRHGDEGRYSKLFDSDGRWFTNEDNASEAKQAEWIDEFKQKVGNFDNQQRIKELKAMLRMGEPYEKFQYMTIGDENDYQGRPVLPYPTEIEEGVYND